MAAARTSRDTLANRRHEFDTVESKEVLCAAANIHWKGAPTSLHDPVFGALGLMGRMRALQYLGMFDLAEQFRVEEQDGVSNDDDEGNVDARERVVESEDESDEPDAGDRTTLAEPHAVDDADDEEVGVVDDRFLPGEEEPESKDGDGDIAHEIPTDPAKIPLPKSDDDGLLEEAGSDDIDPVSATTKSTKSEPEPDDADDADADSGESDSDESDSGDELFWSSPINGTLELEEEYALDQDAAGGADQGDESRNENDSWVTTNPRKRARTPGPEDEEDEPPCKMARVDEEELLNRFEGSVLKLAIYNVIQRNLASKLEANSYWHDILFD